MAITTITKRYFDDNFYIYDPRQYTELKIGTIVASSLSMVSSLLVIISYLYLTKYNASKAKRVSLRCVFMACVMNLMNAIFDITSVIGRGDTPYCRASNMIIMFGGAMCATFLAIVGINLVLVFVINVKISASKLERVYYPCGILYGLFTLAVPIYETARDPQAGGSEFLCYYYINYYQFDGHITLAWVCLVFMHAFKKIQATNNCFSNY
jgi:Na+-transporting NADH:ubiquinone oxidoreductase subunit NqrB